MKIFLSKQFWIGTTVLILAGVLVLVLINLVVMPSYTKLNEGLTIPDVTKLPIDKAIEVLKEAGLRDSIIDRRYNAAFPAEYVIDQTPSPSLIVKPGRKIYLTVNTSSTPKVIVPSVKDLSLRNAELQLQNYGLRLGTVSYESSPFKNTVIKQSVESGTPVERGTIISLVISDGLGIKKALVPDLSGLRLYEAQAKLRTLGLRIGEIQFRSVSDQESNRILDYSPKADSLIEGAKVNLIVSELKGAGEITEQTTSLNDSTQVVFSDSTQIPNQPFNYRRK
jgi:eukaryotic-like serine/threonine-protein kinase